MTDVDETIPLATLSITPQTPGITAGTGTVNTIPLATLSITPNAPGFQRYPLFEVLDNNGNRIDTVTFENLEAGGESDVQSIVLVNNSGSSVDVTLTATLGDNGTLTETATSTYLSEDDTDYTITTDTFTVPAESSLPIYIKWRPPSTSRPGLKTWSMDIIDDTYTGPTLEGWMNVCPIQVTGSSDGSLTDYQIDVEVIYSGYLSYTDFRDIRFTDSSGNLLPHHLKTYTEGVEAVFTVLLSSIPASPSVTTIYMFSGNPEATSTSTSSVYLFFDDATGTYADKWTNITGTGSYTEVGGVQAIRLGDASMIIRTNTFQTTTPFKLEAQLYSTAVITAIQYCQDSTPVVNERYQARIDVRSTPDGGDTILNGASMISNTVDQFSTASEWVDTVLTLDGSGNHTWTVDNSSTPAVASNSDYTSGYLVLQHHNSGVGAVANIRVSKYTQHPPVVEDGDWVAIYDISLNGGVVYSIPDLPELDLGNHYFVNVGGVSYE